MKRLYPGFDGMIERDDGQYVLYEEAMQEIAALTAEINRLKISQMKPISLRSYESELGHREEKRRFSSLEDDWRDSDDR